MLADEARSYFDTAGPRRPAGARSDRPGRLLLRVAEGDDPADARHRLAADPARGRRGRAEPRPGRRRPNAGWAMRRRPTRRCFARLPEAAAELIRASEELYDRVSRLDRRQFRRRRGRQPGAEPAQPAAALALTSRRARDGHAHFAFRPLPCRPIEFRYGPKLIAGPGAAGRLAELLPPGRCLFVTDANVRALGLAGGALEALAAAGIDQSFDAVEQDPSRDTLAGGGGGGGGLRPRWSASAAAARWTSPSSPLICIGSGDDARRRSGASARRPGRGCRSRWSRPPPGPAPKRPRSR